MKMTTTGRKCTLRPSFVERTEAKLSKLDKFFDAGAAADVTVSNERDRQRVEITIRYNGMVFRAEEIAEDANEAVDRLMDVLLRQIRKTRPGWKNGCGPTPLTTWSTSRTGRRKNIMWLNPNPSRSSPWMSRKPFSR